MTTTKGMLEKILHDLKSTGDVEASAIVSRDGLLMARDIPREINGETFAAMSATMLGAAETAINELKKGGVNRIIVESKQAKILASGAGEKALLVIMTSPDAGLGLILIEMDKACSKISGVV